MPTGAGSLQGRNPSLSTGLRDSRELSTSIRETPPGDSFEHSGDPPRDSFEHSGDPYK